MLGSRLFPSPGPSQYFVVLLPAFPLSNKMWESAVEAFEDLRDDTSFLVIDFPGFGDSPMQSSWTMQSVAGEIRTEIIKHTKGRVVLGGLSMGGYEAFAFYREYSSMLNGLVLSNTKPQADNDAMKRYRESFALDALKRGPESAIERLYSKFVTENTDPAIAIDIQNWIREASGDAIASALKAMANRADSSDLLRLISIPSLVISSTEDKIIPDTDMQTMAMQLQDSTYIEMKGASHLTAAERPQEWAEALASFLDRL
jgi:3-oxoadipate enol-lactonase